MISTINIIEPGEFVKLSTRSRNGVKILLDLSINQGKGPVPVGDISQRQEISVKYIDQLMRPLKQANLIRSVRGPKGGFLLARSAELITLGAVICAMEGGFSPMPCLDHPETCVFSPECLIQAAWGKAIQAMLDELDTINLTNFYDPPPEGQTSSFKPPCGARFTPKTR